MYFGLKEFMLEVSVYILNEIYYDKYIYSYAVCMISACFCLIFISCNVISENNHLLISQIVLISSAYATYIVHLLQIIEYVLFQIIIDKNAKETKLIKVFS